MPTQIPDLFPVSKVSNVHVPLVLPECTQLQGFAFSRKLLATRAKTKYPIPKDQRGRRKLREVAKKARQLAAQSDGGPGVGRNYISITISNDHENASSRTDHIELYFNSKRKFLRLWGLRSDTRFPAGRTIEWDMSVGSTRPANWIETVPTDAWDNLVLVNPSGDGLLIDRIKIVHSDFTLVDWPTAGKSIWLDGSLGERYGMIGLADQILENKLAALPTDIRRVSQLHWAATELGKTDGTKYGCTGPWCSEFASWCLRKSGFWDAPIVPPEDFDSDGIGSGTMRDYFDGLGRKKDRDDLTSGAYRLTKGDYLRFDNHSALFVRYLDDGLDETSLSKQFETIDGNISARVCINTRQISEILNVGSTI
jgi:hypothetical protein